jgi:hypothetical protein
MERLTVEIPAESICIRNACCPAGHSVMDPDHLMSGVPSIKLLVQAAGEQGTVHLNAWYGNYDIDSTVELNEGTVYDLLCPTCKTSLRNDEEHCMFCGAGMFSLLLGGGGTVQACARMGCHNHKLKLVDFSAVFAKFFDLDTKPRF